MLSLGVSEILLIAALLLVVVGPERLPHAMRWAGQQYGKLRRAADDMRRAFVLEADRMDAEERYEKLQQRRKEAAEARKQAADRGAVPQDRTPKVPVTPPTGEAETAPNTEASPPPGISAEEWAETPPAVRDMLLNKENS